MTPPRVVIVGGGGFGELAAARALRSSPVEVLLLDRSNHRLLWHKFRGGQIDRHQLLLRSLPSQKKIFALAERHLDHPHREVRNLATSLFEHNHRLFTSLEHKGVEPTNNSAERALRTGVQLRKICFGNRSANGDRSPRVPGVRPSVPTRSFPRPPISRPLRGWATQLSADRNGR